MTYTVDTPRSRRRFRWPRLPLGEGQAAWTTRALMLLAPLLSFTLVEYLNYNNPWTDFTSLQIALNLAWYYLGELFFYFVLRRRASAVKWAMGIAWGLGMANHYLISFRGRTLFPGDFLTLRTAANVAGNYDYRPDSMQWLTIGVFAAVLLGGLLREKPLGQAAADAVSFVQQCVGRTLALGTPPLEGVEFEGLLGQLTGGGSLPAVTREAL